jgi:hypothetical protein
MKNPVSVLEADALKAMTALAVIACVVLLAAEAFAQISSGPRQTGGEVLPGPGLVQSRAVDESLMSIIEKYFTPGVSEKTKR